MGIDHKITSDIVKNTVQRVIDSSYRSVCWNYSSSHHCTLDHPTNSDIEQCIAVAKSRFKAYTESHIEAHFPVAQPNSIDSQNALDGRGCPATGQLAPPVSHKRTVMAEPSGELVRPPPPKKQCIDDRYTGPACREEHPLVEGQSEKFVSEASSDAAYSLQPFAPGTKGRRVYFGISIVEAGR